MVEEVRQKKISRRRVRIWGEMSRTELQNFLLEEIK